MINSGSGNQGITASIPVYVYAKELNVSEEKLYRALLVSNLVTLHEKTGIGRLSAYCGAVSAGAGAGAGITYLYGGGCREISHTIVNALAVTSGHRLRRGKVLLRGENCDGGRGGHSRL